MKALAFLLIFWIPTILAAKVVAPPKPFVHGPSERWFDPDNPIEITLVNVEPEAYGGSAQTSKETRERPSQKKIIKQASRSAFDIRDASVAEVVQLIYANAVRTPYVLSPELVQDLRPLTFRWSSTDGSIETFLIRFLDSLGYKVESRGGVDYVMKKGADDEYGEYFIYHPRYRTVDYLTGLVSTYFKGRFSTVRQVASNAQHNGAEGNVPSTSVAALIDQNADTLIFRGTPEEIGQLKKLLAMVDVLGGEVLVRGLVYEVGVNELEGSAFSLISSLFGGKLQIGVSSGIPSPVESFLSFKNLTIDLVANMLSSDSRFKVISSPSIRMRSGVMGSFSVGQDVPVLGSVSYDRNGSPIQSVEYRSSGVIFRVRPNVFEEKINLDIDQQLSNFVRTETGVNDSPTLTKRELKTSVSVTDGEVIVLGGLAEFKDNNGRTGFSFLPDFMRWNTATTQRSEIVLVLQVQRL